MKKIALIAVIFAVLGVFLLMGSARMNFDLKPMGLGLGLISAALLIGLSVWQNKNWNLLMAIGTILAGLGVLSVFAAVSFLPDFRPIITTAIAAILGLVCYIFGFIKSAKSQTSGQSFAYFNLLAALVIVFLLGIALVLLPQINWSHPKDPAGVMLLTFFSALLIIYALISKHPAQKQIVYAGLIAVINFFLIPLYEAGTINFLAKFYRLFEPLYAGFDNFAEPLEYVLIAITVIAAIIFSVKRIKIKKFGKITLVYFILMPLLAIFLFEMMGLPAGFLAGDTTRTDLLVTDTNAVMSTFGMIFIAAVCYMTFQLFPFFVTPLIAGIWWVFWKPWLLHHPDPARFTSFAAFAPAGLFLFFTGVKRAVLPMILIILPLLVKKK